MTSTPTPPVIPPEEPDETTEPGTSADADRRASEGRPTTEADAGAADPDSAEADRAATTEGDTET